MTDVHQSSRLSIWRLSTSTEPLRGGMLQWVDCPWQDGSITRFCYRRHRGERRIRSSCIRAWALPACKTATVYQQTQCGRKQVWRCRLNGVRRGFGQDARGLPPDRQSMTPRFSHSCAGAVWWLLQRNRAVKRRDHPSDFKWCWQPVVTSPEQDRSQWNSAVTGTARGRHGLD